MYFELSYTRRKTLACPYSAQCLYFNGESVATQLDGQAGTIGHEHIARYILHLQSRHRQRDTEWFVDELDKLLAGKDPYITSFLDRPLGKFLDWYTHRRDVQHEVEQEYWCTVDGEPMAPLEPGLPLPCDCYHGRADWIEVEYGGAKATVHDWKLGWDRKYLSISTQLNEQLMGYCWLYLVHHPECEQVVGALHPLRWTTTPLYGAWSRAHLMELMPSIIKADFETVRRYYNQYGNNPWPAVGDYETTCRWCMLSCPLYNGEE